MVYSGTTTAYRSFLLEPCLSNLERVRAFIEEVGAQAGLSPDRVFDIKVAVSEACANAIEHGLAEDQVDVKTRMFPDRLEVDISSPRPFLVPSPKHRERGQHRGLGLPIMASLSDHLAVYSTPEGGTLITLTFYRPAAPREDAEDTLPPSVRALVEQNALVSSIVDAVPVSLFVLDPDLRFHWANRALLDQLREPYRSLGVVGTPLADAIPDLAREDVQATLRRVSQLGEGAGPEERELRRTDKRILHIVWQAVPLVREKPAPPYDVLLIATDITERRRAEQELRESERRFRSLYDSSIDAVILARADGTVRSANAAARRLFQMDGFQTDGGETAATTLEALVVADERLHRAVRERADCGLSAGELTFRRADGSTFEGEFSSHTFPDTKGHLETSLVVRDITTRRRSEEHTRCTARFNALRLALNDALRETGDPDQIKAAAVRLLQAHFDGAEVDYAEISSDVETPSTAVTPVSSEYGAGRVLSRVRVPVFKGDRLVGRMSVEVTTPRTWSGPEVALIAEAAERTREAIERARSEQALRESEERFRTMFERHTAVMLLIEPASGVIVDGNGAAVTFYGYSKDQLVHMRIEDINMLPNQEVARLREEAVSGRHHRFLAPHLLADGRVRWVDVYSAPMELRGRCLLFSVIHDVTEKKQAEDVMVRQTRIMGGINRVFREALRSSSLETLGRQCLLTARDLTESAFGFIGEIREDGLLYPIALTDPGMQEQTAAQGSGHLTLPALLHITAPFTKAIDDEQGFFTNLPSFQDASLQLPDGHPQLTAFLAVPLREGGKATGMIGLANRHGGYRQEDLETVRALAPAIAEALSRKSAEEELRRSEERLQAVAREKERLYEEQRTIAQKLQLAFIHVPVSIDGLSIGHLYHSATEAAKVGGDFYDVFPVRNGHIAVLIGDVAGHGIDAARAATLTKDAAHAFSHQSIRPEVVLRSVNELLVEILPEGFVTMFMGVLDPATGSLRYGSAGHPQPLLRRAGGRVEKLELGELPLGVFKDVPWTTSHATLDTGDLLFLYTDGLTEARHRGRLFGEEALAQALSRHGTSPATALPQGILDDVLRFSHGVLQDDVAIMALRRA